MNPWLIALFAFSAGGLMGLLFASLFVVNRDELLHDMARCLKECSNDLAVHLDRHYAYRADYPRLLVDFDVEMAPVLVARRLLAEYHQVPS